jgi:hypothetical protein
MLERVLLFIQQVFLHHYQNLILDQDNYIPFLNYYIFQFLLKLYSHHNIKFEN